MYVGGSGVSLREERKEKEEEKGEGFCCLSFMD